MSPIEVERKRELPGSGEAARLRLTELGYRQDGQFMEVDTYYSPQHVDYLATVECLRVRQRDGFAEITYKPASDSSTHSSTDVISKVETNVLLANPEQAAHANRLLSCVGMIELARVEKARTVYRHPKHGGVVVAIDMINSLGTFVETEVTAVNAPAPLSWKMLSKSWVSPHARWSSSRTETSYGHAPEPKIRAPQTSPCVDHDLPESTQGLGLPLEAVTLCGSPNSLI